MKTLERQLQRQCEELLNIKNIPYLHLTTAIHRQVGKQWRTFAVEKNKGFPDLTIFFPKKKGGAVFCELKSAKGKLKPEQIAFREQVEGLGFKYFVVRSLEEFETIIDKGEL